jgi:hypothetical protein
MLPILLVGRTHMQREQVAQRVDGELHLRATLTLGTVVTSALAALGRRLERSAVEDGAGA